MDDYWFRALQAAEAAEAAARRLRQRYGAEAEAHVQEEAAPEAPKAATPRPQDIRRALRWTRSPRPHGAAPRGPN